jgi:hypothetical protein
LPIQAVKFDGSIVFTFRAVSDRWRAVVDLSNRLNDTVGDDETIIGIVTGIAHLYTGLYTGTVLGHRTSSINTIKFEGSIASTFLTV